MPYSPSISKNHHRSNRPSKERGNTDPRPAGRISGWRYFEAALLKPWMLHRRASIWIE
jgi:hypothetical protein